MKNKKGRLDLGNVLVIGVIVIAFIVLSGGKGFFTLTSIASALAKIPTIIWIILIFIFIIKMIKK